MTGSDSYPLSKVHLIQKWVISVAQDKFETLLFCRAILTIWINFGPIWSILVHLMGDPTTQYDKIKLIKWTHNQSWTKMGENGCAHKSEIPLEWLDDGKQRTT